MRNRERNLINLSSTIVWLCLLATGIVWAQDGETGPDAGKGGTGSDDSACLDCHGESDLEAVSEARKGKKLYIAPEALVGSVHEDLSCTDCHVNDEDKETPHSEGGPTPKLLCGDCHESAVEDYEKHCIHGSEYNKGNKMAPWCQDCHGGHKIFPLSSEASLLSPRNQPEVCAKCHGNEKLNEIEGGITKRNLLKRYYSSIHWESVQEGKPAATCSDCHGHHDILPSSDKNSHVTRLGQLTTCEKCHKSSVRSYKAGSHGRSFLHGNLDVPVCTTCHGDHDAMSLKMKSSGKRDFAATQVCIWCHGNERMMSRYALDTSPVSSYFDDFHGRTQRGSFGTSATCADCHDAHRSLPTTHPESRMHITNRGSTCGTCHGQSNDTFIMSFTHRSGTPEESRGKIKQIVVVIYVTLILITIGAMLLHNAIIWSFFARRKFRYNAKHCDTLRMNALERRWHWILFLSFTLLALTGFALSFSESTWFIWMYDLGLSEHVRAWIHRVSAVILMANMILFLFYKTISRWGRRWWKEMMPGIQDLRDMKATMLYYLERSPDKPKYGTFNYAEKAEYWALWWGILVMALTGFVLWFTNLLPPDSPPWLIEVARTIHFYEAVLACLSIIVWHIFHVMFHPEEYPINTVWITGSMTKHEAAEKFTEQAIKDQIPPPRSPQINAEPEKKEWMEDE